MSDVGRLRRTSGTMFPSVRKSADPFMPEMAQIDFSHDVQEYDRHFSTTVSESEKSELNTISDETRRRQFRQRKRREREEEEQKKAAEEDEDLFVNLTV